MDATHFAGRSLWTQQMQETQPDAPSLQAVITKESLAAAFAERAQHAMDRAPALFRSGRGRIQDFANLYDLSRQNTAKIFDGDTLPGLLVLAKFSRDTQVSLDYLLGLADTMSDAINAQQTLPAVPPESKDARDEAVQLALYEVSPTGLKLHGSLTMPRWTLPLGLWESELIAVRWSSRAAEQYLQSGSFALVSVSAVPADGCAHLALWGGQRAEALHVTSQRGGENYSLTNFDGRSDTIDGAQTVFGLLDQAGHPLDIQKGMLQVVGPIVGRLEVTDRGVRVASAQSGSPYAGLL